MTLKVRLLPMLLILATPIFPTPSQTLGRTEKSRAFSVTEAPGGAEGLAVQWVKVPAPGGGFMLAAIARPRGTGPFSAVILFHGTHGFARQYVELAQDLAHAGFLAVAACWFSGGGGAGSRFITPISCPEASPMPRPDSPEAAQRVEALVQAARALPDLHPDRLVLFGHSRGGGAILNYVLNEGHVQAAILDSAGYPDELKYRASQLNIPILMLHGTADSPADGGSVVTSAQSARNFEAALRQAGKSVEAKYYEGGRHNGIFTNSAQRNDEVHQVSAFLDRVTQRHQR